MEEMTLKIATHQWREHCRVALSQSDPQLVRKNIDLACTSILQRIDELGGARDASAIEEQLEILESLRQLRAIQTQEFQSSAADAARPAGPAAQEGAA